MTHDVTWFDALWLTPIQNIHYIFNDFCWIFGFSLRFLWFPINFQGFAFYFSLLSFLFTEFFCFKVFHYFSNARLSFWNSIHFHWFIDSECLSFIFQWFSLHFQWFLFYRRRLRRCTAAPSELSWKAHAPRRCDSFERRKGRKTKYKLCRKIKKSKPSGILELSWEELRPE